MTEKRYEVDWHDREKVFYVTDNNTDETKEVTRSELMEDILNNLDAINKRLTGESFK